MLNILIYFWIWGASGRSKQYNIVLYCLVLKEISQEFDSFLAMTFQEAFKLTIGN